MKSYTFKALAFGMAAFSFAACSDSFLDKVPDERTDIDTEDKVIQLLTGAYPGASPAWIGEISSDNLIDNQTPHLPSSPNDKQELHHYNYSQYTLWDDELFRFDAATQAAYSAQDSPGSLWGNSYSSIATCNAALQAIDKIAPDGNYSDNLAAAKGEALLLRAYNHFQLVTIFSQAYKNDEESKKDIGVPYVTEVEDVVNKHYDRGNVTDTYAKIGEDLEAGMKLLTDVNFKTAPKYHFNTNAAHAFAARYYLMKRDYQKVIENANFVIGTDSASYQKMCLDYSKFSDCTSTSDYGLVWQNPDQNNNLMILDTYSLIARRAFGYRYSCAGEACSDVLMIRANCPFWSRLICPVQSLVSAQILGSSSQDYGFFSAKVMEQFQYTDKVAGIGYVHLMYRAFTAQELLLERAEAKAMLGDTEGALNDLRWYWNCTLNTFSADDYKSYVTGKMAHFITNSEILDYYSRENTPNSFSSWAFTQQISPDFVVPEASTIIMNCVNDFRRYETAFEGLRFLDIKRWGLEVTHKQGTSSTPYTLQVNDTRRAIEVPWEAMSAGFESSRPVSTADSPLKKATLNKNNFIKK